MGSEPKCLYVFSTETQSCTILYYCSGEEISGSDGSGSDDMDEGELEVGDGGERRKKRRGMNLPFQFMTGQH